MTGLHATRIGHSCHLLEIDGLRLLTDPWFTVTPTYDPGEPVSLSVEQLPGLDGVIITHEHYDHCDLDALAGYRDTGVPVMVPQTVAAQAKDHGFTDVRVLEPWQHTEIGGVTVTAAPGKHGVPEITYVLQARGRTVYFGGDTLAIPELRELPGRFGHFDLALLPTNGLCIRPMNGQQVVMNATPAGVISTVAGVVRANGNPASGAENSGAAATASHLSAPESVAVDRSSGTLYIADTNNSAVAAVIGVAKAGASAAGPGARRRSPDARLRDNEETNGEQ